MRRRLSALVPQMIGLGMVTLCADGIAIVLRLMGLDKWTAIYFAVLFTALALSLWVRHWWHSDEPRSE